MKTASFISLGLLALAALPLEAAPVMNRGDMPFISPDVIAGNGSGDSATSRILPDGVVDVAQPSVPLIGDFHLTTNGGQPGDLMNQPPSSSYMIPPITNGPGTPAAAVPEPGSSVLFLVLGAVGMIALRRRLRLS